MEGTSDDSVTSSFQKHLSDLRSERLTALGEVAGVHVAMRALLQHEAVRLEGKLGGQHPRTQQLKVGAEFYARLVQSLELECQLARIDVPQLPDDGALIHGRVVDAGDLGIDRLTICVVDRSGASIPDTRESTSDASGYFAIPLVPEAVDSLNKRHPEGVFLAVLSPKRRLVQQESKSLAPARGTRVLLTIRLKGFGPPCTKPN
jgi:hypothetical protein